MTSLVQTFSDRKRCSGVRRYFEYNAQTRAGAAGRIGPTSIQAQLDWYIADIQTTASATLCNSSIEFWEHNKSNSKTVNCLALLAQDLVVAPASQAYVGKLFSVCDIGMLTAGNRMEKSLQMRVWLKVNSVELVN